MYQLQCFGGCALTSTDGPLAGPVVQRRRLALLALVACAPTGAISRDKLVAYLWPDADREHARHFLADSLSTIRRALGRDAVLTSGDDVRLNPDVVGCDVLYFQAQLAQGADDAAIGSYVGPFLDGFFIGDAPEFERWVDAERDRLARACAAAFERLAGAAEVSGDWAMAAASWRRLAAMDPFSARVTTRLMRALDAAGDRAAALEQAHRHETAMRDELELDADPAVVQLAAALRSRASAAGADGHTRHPVLARPRQGLRRLSLREPGGRTRLRAPAGSRARWWRWAHREGTVMLTLVGILVLGGLMVTHARTGKAASPAIRSIAVLPLDDFSGDTTQAYFSEGMTDALITALARLRSDLRVAPRSSVMQFRGRRVTTREVARELKVDAIVEGSVVREAGRVRVAVQLVHAATDRHLWAERYERDLRQILLVQADIADAIAREIGHRAPGRDDLPRRPSAGSVDPAVYEAYLRGRHALLRRSVLGTRQAIAFLEQSLAGDSAFAPAWAGLADAYLIAANLGVLDAREAYPGAKAAALRALDLDDRLAEAYAALGSTLRHENDASGAEAALRRAIALDPNYAIAHQKLGEFLSERGDFAEAERELSAARNLDPVSPVIQCVYGYMLAQQGHYDRAIAEYRRVLEQDSTHVLAHSLLGASLIFAGRPEEALEAMRRFEAITGVRRLQHIGVAYARLGRRAEALGAYAEIERRRGDKGRYALAAIATALGDNERAFRLLSADRANGSSLRGLRFDPWFAALRSDARFDALVQAQPSGAR